VFGVIISVKYWEVRNHGGGTFIWNFSNKFFLGRLHLSTTSDMLYPACVKSIVSYLGISFPMESKFALNAFGKSINYSVC